MWHDDRTLELFPEFEGPEILTQPGREEGREGGGGRERRVREGEGEGIERGYGGGRERWRERIGDEKGRMKVEEVRMRNGVHIEELEGNHNHCL